MEQLVRIIFQFTVTFVVLKGFVVAWLTGLLASWGRHNLFGARFEMTYNMVVTSRDLIWLAALHHAMDSTGGED